MRTEDFFYELPAGAIAQEPAEPRDSARLLDVRDLSDHTFLELPDLLGEGDLLVVNETKVRPARLETNRIDTGGRVELLLLRRLGDGTWECMTRPSRRLRPGIVLEAAGFEMEILDGPDRGLATVDFGEVDVEAALAEIGEVPLPPYFEGELNDPDRYQTMFASTPGSAAAPTAGLHFTERVVDGLSSKGVSVARIDLHVGLDTFRPISSERIEDHRMHQEWCDVSAATAAAIAETRSAGGRVVAVGTTSVRALESMARPDGTVEAGSMSTSLFLRPGSAFRVVDSLVTNFHVPGSTLVVLLASFMGPKWRAAYETALDRGYRFLSFGDAMYCERWDGAR